MIQSDNETKVDLLKKHAIANTVIGLLREWPGDCHAVAQGRLPSLTRLRLECAVMRR